jgi:hypothetical protein
MLKLVFMSLLIMVSVMLTSCGSVQTTAESILSKPVNIVFSTNPNPPTVGYVGSIIFFNDSTGKPITDATVDVSADHTHMSEMGMNGIATEQEDGKYSLRANFSMSGDWKLNIFINKEGWDYMQEINLDVQ